MTEYTSIRVKAADKAEAEASKREDESWSDYIRRCTDNPPEPTELVAVDDLELHDDLERLKNAVETIEERTNGMERQLESMSRARQ